MNLCLLNASSNSTGLNFKITDICEAAIYDTSKSIPKVKRVEVITTQHIAQFAGKKHGTPNLGKGEYRREPIGDENEREFPL
jgi:hypothetical protein